MIYLADEPFFTFQGEGPYTGFPALFIRFWGCNFHCGFCFVGSTKITTPDGMRNIEDIKKGDKVFSFNQTKGIVEEDVVTEIMSRDTNEDLFEIMLVNGEVLTVTGNHEFLTKSGWKCASELNESDILVAM